MQKSIFKQLCLHHKIFMGCVIFFTLISILYFYQVYPMIEFNLSSTNVGEPVCVFYADVSMTDFDAEHVVQDIIRPDNQMYHFSVPNSRALRIDLGTNEGQSKISNVKIKTLFTIKELSIQQLSSSFFSADISQTSIEGDALFIESSGVDPYIVFENLNEFDSRLNLQTLGTCFFIFALILFMSGIIALYYQSVILFFKRNILNNIVYILKRIWNTVEGRCIIILSLFSFFYLFNTYPKIEFEMLNSNANEVVQVYYDNGNSEFDGSHMSWDLIRTGKRKYSFPIPNSDILRIGFGTSAGTAKISNVKIKKIFTTKTIPLSVIASGEFSADVGEIIIKNDELVIENTGLSPYVVLRNLSTINYKFNFYKIPIWISGFILILFISRVLAQHYEMIEKFLNIRKKYAVLISFAFFLIYRTVFLIRHNGFFAIDEFFHIATLNPDYVTDYNRAPYINYMIKVLCLVFGQSDIVVKLAPFIMGLISFLCGLYLLYMLYDNSYWIITINSILICMPCIAFNHFYIRMYVYLEAIIMINCVLLYNAHRKKGTRWEKISILTIVVLTLSYWFYTKDMSATALLALMSISILYYIYINYTRDILKKGGPKKIRIFLLIMGCLLIITGILNRNRIFVFINWMIKISFNERFYNDNPIFLEFIFKKLFYISIPFFISIVYTWRNKIEKAKIFFIIALLPILGYIAIFHNVYYFRTYNAFLPILCILSYLFLDKIKLSNIQHLVIIIIALILTLNIEDGFWKLPRMTNEVNFSNLSAAVSDAKDLEKQGYEIVPFMTIQRQLAYYDLLNVNTNLQMEDVKREIWESDNDSTYNSTQYLNSDLNEEAKKIIVAEFDKIFNSDSKKVLITDEVGTGIFWTEFHDDWLDKCKIQRYPGYVNVIVVN